MDPKKKLAMDKKQNKGGRTMNQKVIQEATLREANTRKKHVDVNSMLRMEHLQKLAAWASLEAGIAPLGALFGHRLAACAEANGVPLDPSTFFCERCESVLKPGSNCTVRIENIKKKAAKRRRKQQNLSQNKVVYKCHFCSHPNLMRGTQRGYLKGLLPSKPKPTKDSKVELSSNKMNPETIPRTKQEGLELDAVTSEATSEKTPLTLLESLANSSKRKRKTNKKPITSGCNSEVPMTNLEGTGGPSKRKRKGWSSLKKIAENNEAQGKSISNFAIPFIL